MNQYDAFISFSFKDQAIVENVISELETEYGISCWTCLEYVKSGQSYKELIPAAIKNSGVSVVFISKNSVTSTEVPKEVGIALKYKKAVIPFRLDDAEYQGRLEYDLEGVNYIDSSIPLKDRIKELAKAICHACGKTFSAAKPPATRQAPANDKEIYFSPASSNLFNEEFLKNISAPQTKTPSPPEKKKVKPAILAVTILTVAALVLSIGFGVFISQKGPEDTVNETQNSAQPILTNGNMVNDGLVCEQDGVIYYQNHADNWYLYKEDENGTDYRLNTDNSWCICSDGEYVYYANVDDGSSVYRIKTDGEGREKLNSDNCSNLMLDGDYVYYIDSNSDRKLFKMKKDGAERQKVTEAHVNCAAIYDGRIYAASKENIFSVATNGSDLNVICQETGSRINVYDGKIFFVNQDNGNIYSINTDGSDLTKVSDDSAGYMNVYNGRIYYQNLSDEGHLCSVKLNSGEKSWISIDDCRYINVTSDKIYYREGKDTKHIYYLSHF